MFHPDIESQDFEGGAWVTLISALRILTDDKITGKKPEDLITDQKPAVVYKNRTFPARITFL